MNYLCPVPSFISSGAPPSKFPYVIGEPAFASSDRADESGHFADLQFTAAFRLTRDIRKLTQVETCGHCG
jgi:hypothetical protein